MWLYAYQIAVEAVLRARRYRWSASIVTPLIGVNVNNNASIRLIQVYLLYYLSFKNYFIYLVDLHNVIRLTNLQDATICVAIIFHFFVDFTKVYYGIIIYYICIQNILLVCV